MILQSLYELYGRLKNEPEYQIIEPGYSIQKVSFKVVIKPNGELFDIQDIRQIEGKKKISVQKKMLGNGKPPGSGINPCFLWDNSTYMLGYKKDDQKPERTYKSFEAFRDLHLKFKDKINIDDFKAICNFLENWNPQMVCDDEGNLKYKILDETGFGVFQVLGKTQFVHEDPKMVNCFFENFQNKNDKGIIGQCLISGEITNIAKLQPKIKGINGGQVEQNIVSFNAKAYESYAKEQSFNAPVSKDAAFKYGVALNSLLNGPMSHKHRFSLGDSTVAFWTDKPSPVENIFAQFASDGITALNKEVQDETLRQSILAFLKGIRNGSEVNRNLEEENTKFFLLALSPNAARTSVRFFHKSTVKDLFDKLNQHFSDIKIEQCFKEGKSKNPDPEFPAFWQLLRQTARDSKEIPPLLSAPLLKAVLMGHLYPQGLYSAVIRRLRCGDKINYLKASIIKGYLIRNIKWEVSMSLDKTRKEPAYLLGRLFATLEKTQADALGDVGAGFRERYYSSASATPAAVFPRILRTHQHHLAKLKGGQKVNREKLLQEIIGSLDDFSKHLNLNQQGLFAIGYYHQNLDFYTKNEDKDN